MARCPNCNSCTTYTWVNEIRYLYCSFCNKFFSIISNKLQQVFPAKLDSISASYFSVKEPKRKPRKTLDKKEQ